MVYLYQLYLQFHHFLRHQWYSDGILVNHLIHHHWYPLENVWNWRLNLNQKWFCFWVTNNELIFMFLIFLLFIKRNFNKVSILSFHFNHIIYTPPLHFIGSYIPPIPPVLTHPFWRMITHFTHCLWVTSRKHVGWYSTRWYM